ncbi:hypothetical protein ACO0QE_001989 [Hanseniaspora vineae]
MKHYPSLLDIQGTSAAMEQPSEQSLLSDKVRQPESQAEDDTYNSVETQSYFSIIESHQDRFKIIPVSELVTLPQLPKTGISPAVPQERTAKGRDITPTTIIQSPNTNSRYCNQYKILKEIGQGQYAKVYKAITPVGELVAIKQFRKKPLNHQSQYSFKQIQAYMMKQQRGKKSMYSNSSVGSSAGDSVGNSSHSSNFHLNTPMTPNTTQSVDSIIMNMTLDKIRWELYVLGTIQDSQYVVQLVDCIDSAKSKKNWIVFEYSPFGEVQWRSLENQMININSHLHKSAKLTTQVLNPLQFCVKFIHDTAQGLQYLKQQCCIHRDIKPSNILIFPDLTFKISDFGSSIIHPDRLPEMGVEKTTIFTKFQNELNKIVGTPAFIPPEICNFNTSRGAAGLSENLSPIKPDDVLMSPKSNNTTITHQNLIPILDGYKMDVWSLGITVFCIMFGKLPFEGDNEFDTFDKIVNEELVEDDLVLRPGLSNIIIADEMGNKQSENAEMIELLQELCVHKLLVKVPQQRIDIAELTESVLPSLVEFYNKSLNGSKMPFITSSSGSKLRKKKSLKRDFSPSSHSKMNSPAPTKPTSHSNNSKNSTISSFSPTSHFFSNTFQINDLSAKPYGAPAESPKKIKGFFFSKWPSSSRKKNSPIKPQYIDTMESPRLANSRNFSAGGSTSNSGANTPSIFSHPTPVGLDNDESVSVSSGSSINSDIDDHLAFPHPEVINLSDLDDNNNENDDDDDDDYELEHAGDQNFSDDNQITRINTGEIIERAKLDDPNEAVQTHAAVEPPARNAERLLVDNGISSEKLPSSNVPLRQPKSAGLVPSRGTMDFTKYLHANGSHPELVSSALVETDSPKNSKEKKKNYRTTFLRHASSLNFETPDELTRYLSFADSSNKPR